MNPLAQILSAACAALAVVAGVFVYLYQGEVRANAKFKADVEVVNTAVAEANRIKIEQAEQNTRDVAKLYAADADRIRTDYVSRLRRATSACATVPLVASSTVRPDGTAPNAGLDTSFTATCERLEKDCAATTLQTIHLQSWIRKVCK